MSAIDNFNTWYAQQLQISTARIPSACCLSTVGLDGFPNARFVSLKEVLNESFMVTGPLNSRKGFELVEKNKAALTFWWNETGRQVRIQGWAEQINDQLADKYFSERNRESQIVSFVSVQGERLENAEKLQKKYDETDLRFKNSAIPRPDNWGGFAIRAVRMEFLEFKESRFHERKLYDFEKELWTELQP